MPSQYGPFFDTFQTVVFRPHFFSRYRERMGLEDTGDKLIIPLLISIDVFSSQRYQREDGSEGVVFSIDDGIGLGDVLSDRVSVIRTFVPKRMLFDDQLPDFLEYEEYKDAVLARDSLQNVIIRKIR